jgi:hypothetical protein
MGKTWVLDTETKGTGAHMVPLESTLRRANEQHDLATVTLKRPPARAPEPPPEPGPLRFKVVDVLGARELARDIGVREAVGLLEHMSSVLDARIYVWMGSSARWRLLTLDEHRLMWQFRGQTDSQPAAPQDAQERRLLPASRGSAPGISSRSRRSRRSSGAR